MTENNRCPDHGCLPPCAGCEAEADYQQGRADRQHSYAALESALLSATARAAKAEEELAQERKHWRGLVLHIAQHLDPECAEATWDDIAEQFDPLDAVRKAEARVAGLREALRPFAEAWHKWQTEGTFGEWPESQLTGEDWGRAAAALHQEE